MESLSQQTNLHQNTAEFDRVRPSMSTKDLESVFFPLFKVDKHIYFIILALDSFFIYIYIYIYLLILVESF